MIALVDCNNFFVSCERLFNPKLVGKPVIVLSSNDGCIVARSQEVKKLGVPMGVPFFKWKEVLEKHKVISLSCNFSLYADISNRVMHTLSHFNPSCEVYSIDEAFLDLEGCQDPLPFCMKLRNHVLQWTGIPVSIGVAPTKTLAKLASELAKQSQAGVKSLLSSAEWDPILAKTSPKEIWGIGSRMHQTLEKKGIRTALEFKNQSELMLQKSFSVGAVKTALELRGIKSFSCDDVPSIRKSLLTSRSFSRAVTTKEQLLHALATFATRAGEKLREEDLYATAMTVFIMSSRFNDNFFSREAHTTFPQPTAATPTLLKYVTSSLDKIFSAGFDYKRAGVLLSGLVPLVEFQQDLFTSQTKEEKENLATQVVDGINARFGKRLIHFGLSPHESFSSSQKRSPSYTTKWEELPTLKCQGVCIKNI